jgi:broad specificity polyphosphatase/5'/3'-nucleotidase SurE
VAADVVRCLREAGYPAGVDLLSVNYPIEADVETPRVVTELAAVGYDRLFRRKADGIYVHDFDGALRDSADVGLLTDLSVVRSGRVSITPIRLAHTADVTASLRDRLERMNKRH